MDRHTRSRALSLLAAAALVLAACSSSSTPPANNAGATTTTVAATKGNAGRGDIQQGVAGAPAAAGTLSGPITVGLDFKPEADGFSFENYGNTPDRPNLTAVEMERFFGDPVCASRANGQCTLTPPAEQWMQSVNEAMNGGHCEGMAALALLIKKGSAKASDFGADLTNALKIDGNEKLAREIAYWFATQGIVPTSTSEMKTLKPSEVVAKLRESFQPGPSESYTLGIYKAVNGALKDGHAITPYGLVERPDGKVEIAVYDNNFPGAARAVVVDPTTETWTYSTATNPSEPVGLYEGDAATHSLTLTPTSARLGQHQCPFCGGGGGGATTPARGAATGGAAPAADDPRGYLFLNDSAEQGGVTLTVTAPDGSPLTGLETTQIKGADGDLADVDAPPVISVPQGTSFKVTIDGSKVTQEAVTDVTYIGSGGDLYVDEIKVDPGQVDEALFDPAKGQITYTTKKNEAPTIGAGFSAEGADYAFAIGGVDLPDGGSVTAALDVNAGTFSIKNQADKPGNYALGMVRIDDAGEQTFSDAGFDLPPKAGVSLDYKDWSSKNDKLKVTVDPGDGSAPQTTEVSSDK